MKKILTFTLLPLFIATSVNAQENNKPITQMVTGHVKESATKNAEFVTVALLKATDSTSVKGMTTGEDGKYEFLNIKNGSYLIAVNGIGIKPAYSKAFTLSGNSPEFKVPDITLETATKSLKEVTVTGQRPLIEQKLDKTILNVESSISSVGSTAIEVLQKAPGVTVDNDGNISLKGKSGVMVLIDGKPTYMTNTEVADLLRNMSSSSISQIEIMTNPPAKYDAAGNAGIINIKLKKGSNTGFNGSVNGSFGQGNYHKGNAGFNMNYRHKVFNAFANYSYSNRISMQELYLVRSFYNGSGDALDKVFLQNANMEMPSKNNRIKTGIDLFLSKRSTLGFMVNGSVGTWDSKNPTNEQEMNPAMELVGSSFSRNSIAENWNNFTYNTNYKFSIDSSGRELTADFDYANNKYGSDQMYNTLFYDASNHETGVQIIEKGVIPSVANIYAGKIDYTHPLNKSAKFETGLKTSFVTTNNAVDYYTQNDINWTHNDAMSNHFKYSENINAAYINFNKEVNKFSIQLGLRAEQTRTEGDQNSIDTSSLVKRNYFQLFPTAFVKYQSNKNNAFQVSLSRRVNRPDYESLNPFVNKLNPTTYQQGNPYLRPETSNSIEFSHVLKEKFTTTLNYSVTNDVMTDITGPGTYPNSVYVTKDNLSKKYNYGISFTVPITVTKWWSANAFANVFTNIYKGQYLEDFVDRKQTSFTFNAQNTFTFFDGFTGEVSGFYNSKMIEGIIDINPMWMVSAGIQKSIMNKKGSIKFNINDVFNSHKFTGSIKYSDMDIKIRNNWDSQVATLSFTYRFGNTNLKTSSRDNTGSSDESSRTKQGKN